MTVYRRRRYKRTNDGFSARRARGGYRRLRIRRRAGDRSKPVLYPFFESAALAVRAEADLRDAPYLAVHIRRGEVYNNSLDPRGSKVRAHLFGRMTPVRTYMALVKKVAHAINTDCFAGSPNRPPIEVVLAAENAKVIELGRVVSVPDLRPDDAIVRVDSLPGVSSIALAGENVLDAFETLCFADVVIGSKSGFTALAAYLCEAPLFLTMPFWISYLYVPNVLVMTNRNTTTGEFVKFTSRDSRTTPITDSYDLDRMLLRQKLAAYQPWCRVSETASIART